MHFSSAVEVFFASLAEDGFFLSATSDLEAVLVFIFFVDIMALMIIMISSNQSLYCKQRTVTRINKLVFFQIIFLRSCHLFFSFFFGALLLVFFRILAEYF